MMLIAVMLKVFMLNVVKLSVVMLSIVASYLKACFTPKLDTISVKIGITYADFFCVRYGPKSFGELGQKF